jgi:hypothetical protein
MEPPRYYLKKSFRDPQSDLLSLDAVKVGVEGGSLDRGSLARSEFQSTWYPVLQLLNLEATQPLIFKCRQCTTMIRSRHIDIGNPVACASCQTVCEVPDPALRRAGELARTDAKAAKGPLYLGLFILILCLGTCIGLFVQSGVIPFKLLIGATIGAGVAGNGWVRWRNAQKTVRSSKRHP